MGLQKVARKISLRVGAKTKSERIFLMRITVVRLVDADASRRSRPPNEFVSIIPIVGCENGNLWHIPVVRKWPG